MPGTSSSGRPGGNPIFSDPEFKKKYAFKRSLDEPLSFRIQVKVTPSVGEKVKSLPNYPDFLRAAIDFALENPDVIADTRGVTT